MVHSGRRGCYGVRMRNSIRYLLVGFAFVTGSLFALSGLAGAQGNSSDGYVLSKTESRTAEMPAAAAPATAVESASAQGNALAFTGGDAVLLATIGGVAVVAGSAILVARRRIVQA